MIFTAPSPIISRTASSEVREKIVATNQVATTKNSNSRNKATLTKTTAELAPNRITNTGPNTGSPLPILEQSTIDNLTEFLSYFRAPVQDNTNLIPSQATTFNYISPVEVRAFPQVQQTPDAPRKATHSRQGSTRVLTDTPEKNRLELESKKKEEVERKREERLIKRNGAKRALEPREKSNTVVGSKSNNNKENCAPKEMSISNEGGKDLAALVVAPKKTRSGRVIKPTRNAST